MIKTGCANKDKCGNETHQWNADQFLNTKDWEDQIKLALCPECIIEMSLASRKSVFLHLRNHVDAVLRGKV